MGEACTGKFTLDCGGLRKILRTSTKVMAAYKKLRERTGFQKFCRCKACTEPADKAEKKKLPMHQRSCNKDKPKEKDESKKNHGSVGFLSGRGVCQRWRSLLSLTGSVKIQMGSHRANAATGSQAPLPIQSAAARPLGN